MRRRARHWGPKSAGATLALDARYIQQGNSTAVSSWADRSGNAYNADQATGAKQPTFETAGLGGQGAVKFDGGDVLAITSGYANIISGDDTWSLVTVTNLSSFSVSPVVVGQSANFFWEFGNMSSVSYYIGDNVGGYRTYGTGNGTMSTNTTYVAGFTKTASTAGTLYVNGVAKTSFTGTLASTRTATGDLYVGGYTSTPTFPVTGYIGAVWWFGTNLSDSLRKRVDHLAARSFKFACD